MSMTPRILYPDPGTAHAEMLRTMEEAYDELAAEGYVVPMIDRIEQSERLWMTWRKFAPEI
jgi:hypothetical protein